MAINDHDFPKVPHGEIRGFTEAIRPVQQTRQMQFHSAVQARQRPEWQEVSLLCENIA